jgi:hypothetical protein
MNFPNQSCDPELLRLMYGALDAAWDQQQRSWDDIAARARRTAMAFQIMTGVSAGERDPERLKLAALNAHGRPYPWTLQRRTNFKRRSALTNLACNRCTLYVPAVHRRSFMAEHYIGFAPCSRRARRCAMDFARLGRTHSRPPRDAASTKEQYFTKQIVQEGCLATRRTAMHTPPGSKRHPSYTATQKSTQLPLQ